MSCLRIFLGFGFVDSFRGGFWFVCVLCWVGVWCLRCLGYRVW